MKHSVAPFMTSSVPKRRRLLQDENVIPFRIDCMSMLMCNNAFVPCHLHSLGQDPALFQFLHTAKCMPVEGRLVANVMESRLGWVGVQYAGLRILAERGPDMLGAKTFVRRFVEAMKAHLSHPLIQIEACRGLLHWTKKDDQVMEEVGLNICFLMDTLECHSYLLQLRYAVLDIVRGIIGSSKGLLKKISAQERVVSCIMRLLKITLTDVFTQQIGLSILSWIIEEQPSRDVIVRKGGFEHLLDAMLIHPWDDAVQCNAVATLCWLIHSPRYAESSLLSAKGLAIIIGTMKRFLNNPMVFGNSICALSGTMINRAREDVFSIPGVEVANLTLIGMGFHQNSPKVHRNGLTLLRFLIINGGEGQEVGSTVLRSIDVLENSMKAHKDDTYIQVEVCGMLAHLANTSDEARKEIQKSGCVEAVLQGQLRHQNHLRLQHNVLWFLSSLLRDRDLSEAEEAFGGGLQVLATMTTGMVLPGVHDEES